ncbi:MAG: ABC transporter ATP-binding protein [Desulfovibrio sp.]|nr:ABC transporter ATP-binding protein [Desulfovibrio sp.]
MCSEPVVHVQGVAKYFEIYDKPLHRLLQMLWRGRRSYYRQYWALRHIDLTVERGECLGIIGRNGAGKSTLLQILAGTLTPSSGSVEVSGRVAALLELGSGFNPEFTGRENVRLNAAILGLSPADIEERFEAIAAFADIGDFMDQPVKSYSSGMALRLAFAVMAHVDADILIIDEALAVGDAFFTQKCMRFLREFMRHKTVIFVSHDTAAVCSLCSRAVLLHNGEIALSGSPREVSQRYLEELYAEQQGESCLQGQSTAAQAADVEVEYRDMRADLFNGSTLRNDIEVFRFDPQAASFGKGGASIERVWLSDIQERPLQWIVGGERVNLHALCRAQQTIHRPIVGFFISNAYGQHLFGDNTFLTYAHNPLTLEAGQSFEAVFSFRMPVLAAGQYFVSLAIAEGTQGSHVQHQWAHEALSFVSHSTSCTAGLMGIPMLDIRLERQG